MTTPDDSDRAGSAKAERPHADKNHGIPRQRAQEFKLMAKYQHDPEVKALIEAGATRRQVLLAIDEIRGKERDPADELLRLYRQRAAIDRQIADLTAQHLGDEGNDQ